MELYAFGDGYIADTPGFSAVELERYEVIRKEELAGCFSEFAQYSKACKFTGCSHTVEKAAPCWRRCAPALFIRRVMRAIA